MGGVGEESVDQEGDRKGTVCALGARRGLGMRVRGIWQGWTMGSEGKTGGQGKG